MKLIRGLAILTQAELDKELANAEKRGEKQSGKADKARIEELKKSDERKTKEIEKLKDKLHDTEEALSVYKEEREKVREVVKQGLENDDLKSVLDARKEALDKREAQLKDEAQELKNEEGRVQKSAYADGLADGLRKAHEITEKDRENAMKIAMVSAASHTPASTMKGLNETHQLTAGSSN